MVAHAAIIPLLGGLIIGQSQVFGSSPKWIQSYSEFEPNDRHLVRYTGAPYHIGEAQLEKVDVIGTTCPCAGLSSLSKDASSDNSTNDWLFKTADLVLRQHQPKVFWGENAPALLTNVGKSVKEKLINIGKENGYTMTFYRTKSEFHGNPQIRDRVFYFFWKDDKVPLLNWYRREYTPIEELISNVTSNSQRIPINKGKPSVDDPYYRYILEDIHGGITHSEFSAQIKSRAARNSDALAYIELYRNYLEVAAWMEENGYPDEVPRCKQRYAKLLGGKEITRRRTIVPKDKIGAFVGRYPHMLAHPTQDRYIDVREAMTIMGLPDDFEMYKVNSTTINHICQNVPVQTAKDMATEIQKYLNGELFMVDTDVIMQYNEKCESRFTKRSESLESFFS